MTFMESFWLVLEIFFFFAYLMVLFQIVGDLIRDRELGGFAKAMWVLALIVVPLISALVYLIARGSGMARRSAAAMEAAREGTETYIRDVAGTSPAAEIASAKQLLDAGTITPEEFAALKAKALARA